MDRARLLIVEDDPELLELLEQDLGAAYETVGVRAGRDALFRAETEAFDLVLLDLNLPDMDGIEVAEQLSGLGVPIVMLTARADVRSRIEGLYAGADDYITKPFDRHELLARIYARLRAAASSRTVSHGPLEISLDARTATVDGRPLELSAKEFRLLALLVGQEGRIFSKATLRDELYGDDVPASNAVEALVSRLRSSLAGAGLEIIDTVRGLGYVIR